ncbi:serine threonine kinase [Fusarium beomiforme]|uniref:Serine threonine kinase n=1 Tax=Fusarium beomiforme TaxID=44412 RepID=A0A9P5AK42_9HYPO|nr:serine threonine kinase [Fusarium beomiforme]
MFYPRNHPPDERHREFMRFIQEESQPGLDGNDKVTPFIIPTVTARWWKKGRPQRLSQAIDRNIHVLPTTIEKGYLNIFSILVYIGRTYLIKEFVERGFQDQQLPLLDPRRFGDDPQIKKDMESFCDNQWMFCPLIFSSDTPLDMRKIDRRQILPIQQVSKTTTKTNHSKSIIRVVDLYPECFDRVWSSTNRVVFKEYRTQEREYLREAWNKEYYAFVAIESSDYIVKYLGSFEQNNRCFMILEYASGGSLLDLFKSDQTPKTEEERRYFLHGLMGVIKAIDKIQNLGGGAWNQRRGFAHRDIKPANILVFPGTDGTYSSGFHTKLADFDTATPDRPLDDDEFSFQDNGGNRTYCGSPEASIFYRDQERGLRQVPVASDVWSLGCVISEAIIWVAGGMTALKEAANYRRTEISTHYAFLIDNSFGECFHNGSTVLTCVGKSLSAAVDALRGPISLSRSVCNLLESWMLVPVGQRKSPSDIWKSFEGTYHDHFRHAQASGVYGGPPLPQFDFHGTALTESPKNIAESTFRSYQSPQQRTLSRPEAARPFDTASRNQSIHQRGPLGIDTRMSSSNGTPVDRRFSPLWNHGHTQGIAELEDQSPSLSAVSVNDLNLGAALPPQQHPDIPFAGQAQHCQSTPDVKSPIRTSLDAKRPTPQKHQQNGSSMYPNITIDYVVTHRRNNRERESLDGYEQFSNRMGRRYFVFIIDDSVTMRRREHEVVKVIEVLVWLVRRFHPAGPEIRFTSKPDQRYPMQRRPQIFSQTLKMERFIDPVQKWLSGSEAEKLCNMKLAFNRIFDDLNMVDAKRPTSVIVLTDGIWEGSTSLGQEKGVEACITKVIKRMEKKSLGDTTFTFQFLSFGNDPDGLRRLIYLDDHALYGGDDRNRTDIVDHKSSESNVWAILTGSVSPGNDDTSAGPSTRRQSFSQGE